MKAINSNHDVARRVLFYGLLFNALTSALASAQQPANFRHLPVNTELQKLLIGDETVTDALFINGSVLSVKDDEIDLSKAGNDEVRKSLETDKRKGGALAVYVMFDVFKDKAYLSQKGRVQAERRSFDAIAKSLCFDRSLGRDHGSISWETFVAQVNKLPEGDFNTKEDGISCENATLYPVRTLLSRFLTMNTDAVVNITSPVDDNWDGLLEPKLWLDLQKAADSIEFDKYELVLFHIPYRNKYPKEGDKRFSKILAPTKPLGFGSARLNHIKVKEARSR
jgi:hypothetical protein